MQAKRKVKPSLVNLLFLALSALFFQSYAIAASQAEESSPAGDRGIIPTLTNHYQAQPSFYDFSQLPVEKKATNIGLRFIMGGQITILEWHLNKAETKMPIHNHVNEQVNIVKKGKLAVYSQGRKYILRTGQAMVFPPYVPHEFVALEDDTVFLDIQTPARQDFINGEFDKRAKQVFK